jgi:hypothetical protein
VSIQIVSVAAATVPGERRPARRRLLRELETSVVLDLNPA